VNGISRPRALDRGSSRLSIAARIAVTAAAESGVHHSGSAVNPRA
jgi:hypothetical protein